MDAVIGCLFLFFATSMLFVGSTMVYMVYSEAFANFSIITLIRPDVIFVTILVVLCLLFFYKGFIMVWRYIDTKTKGKITYAMVVNKSRQHNHSSSGGSSYYYYIEYIVKNETNNIKKITKLRMFSKEFGEFVKVKQYKNNIIILDDADEAEVPQTLKEELISEGNLKYKKEEKNN